MRNSGKTMATTSNSLQVQSATSVKIGEAYVWCQFDYYYVITEIFPDTLLPGQKTDLHLI